MVEYVNFWEASENKVFNRFLNSKHEKILGVFHFRRQILKLSSFEF